VNYDFGSLFRRLHRNRICSNSKSPQFFLRNSNYEFRVSVTIGLLCPTTDEALVTIRGIQRHCDVTDLVSPVSPLNDTSTSDE
jgi:hypothetical protein